MVLAFVRRFYGKSQKSFKMATCIPPEVSKAICEKKFPPPAEFIAHREGIWQKLQSEYKQFVASQARAPIQITLPDGKTVDAKAWETTPMSIALGISKGLAEKTVIAKVNGELWDLDRPFEKDSTLELLNFTTKDGQYVFWHSSAHVLGEALELIYQGKLCYGPPIDDGFYYDMFADGRQVRPADYDTINKLCSEIIGEKQPFERLEVTKENLLKMFDYNEFKVRILQERVNTPTTLIYKCGPLIDLCRGPHVRHTGCIKSMAVTKSSASYWEGKADMESLQRVYGISFPEAKQLKEWQKLQEEAAKRDHRKLGVEQKLFFFHELSPGSCFFLPAGAHIYNKLVEFIKQEYWNRGFTEVVTPNMYNSKLWEISGHWQNYAENMFKIDVEKQTFGLKPMNCPGHCLMFAHTTRSHRELPLRLADFGVLHRNEYSGALTGLTRVRRFQQDDAHIFCREDQINEEISGCLDFLQHVYGVFGFTFELFLSTRPEKYLGELDQWNKAEKELETSLNASGYKWEVNPGDGAFYGPKIDILICDALKRKHQCATIQLDFQLPQRFDLCYQMEDSTAGEGDASAPANNVGAEAGALSSLTAKTKRPVMIHRAVLGSVERMIAILTESYGGKWPFWLSPRQCLIVPVVSACDSYAFSVKKRIHEAGFMCDVDSDPGRTLNKKIRTGQLEQYNFIMVVGEAEIKNGTVNVRTRDNKVHGEHTVDHVIERFKDFATTRTREAESQF